MTDIIFTWEFVSADEKPTVPDAMIGNARL
jgi:hypothetical protein